MLSSKTTLLSLLTLLLTLLLQPVLAEQGKACGNYACGSGKWNWSGPAKITDISLSVSDTECDAKYVYVALKYTYLVGEKVQEATGVVFENHAGCHAGYKVENTSQDTFSVKIRSIRVVVCRSDALSDTCYTSGLYPNPHA